MVQRKDIPVNDEYTVAVVTEQMNDGGWAVVASIKHRSPSGEQLTDLPVTNLRYSEPARSRRSRHRPRPRLARPERPPRGVNARAGVGA